MALERAAAVAMALERAALVAMAAGGLLLLGLRLRLRTRWGWPCDAQLSVATARIKIKIVSALTDVHFLLTVSVQRPQNLASDRFSPLNYFPRERSTVGR